MIGFRTGLRRTQGPWTFWRCSGVRRLEKVRWAVKTLRDERARYMVWFGRRQVYGTGELCQYHGPT